MKVIVAFGAFLMASVWFVNCNYSAPGKNGLDRDTVSSAMNLLPAKYPGGHEYTTAVLR